MAIWQFSCYIIPKKNVTADMDLGSDEILFWGRQSSSPERIEFLEKQRSWSDNISQYGKSEETCIEFFYQNENLADISCRLDLRSLSKKMLEKIIEYIQEIDGMILYENRIYNPDMEQIVEAMKESKAARFCQNPVRFFDEAPGRNLTDS